MCNKSRNLVKWESGVYGHVLKRTDIQKYAMNDVAMRRRISELSLSFISSPEAARAPAPAMTIKNCENIDRSFNILGASMEQTHGENEKVDEPDECDSAGDEHVKRA